MELKCELDGFFWFLDQRCLALYMREVLDLRSHSIQPLWPRLEASRLITSKLFLSSAHIRQKHQEVGRQQHFIIHYIREDQGDHLGSTNEALMGVSSQILGQFTQHRQTRGFLHISTQGYLSRIGRHLKPDLSDPLISHLSLVSSLWPQMLGVRTLGWWINTPQVRHHPPLPYWRSDSWVLNSACMFLHH